jgi:hypothetical protein
MAMIYVIKFRPRGDAEDLNFRISKTLFAECEARPSREMAVRLLGEVTGGDFLEDTIEIRELREFDPIEVRGQATVFTL